jgi:inosine/xanthosine triphosphate pyrophosphatase family protein
VIHLFLKKARKADEAANFVFVQLIEQQPGIYDKRHADYARRDKTDLAWERISHETKESGFRLCSFETV